MKTLNLLPQGLLDSAGPCCECSMTSVGFQLSLKPRKERAGRCETAEAVGSFWRLRGEFSRGILLVTTPNPFLHRFLVTSPLESMPLPGGSDNTRRVTHVAWVLSRGGHVCVEALLVFN